jgi:hypothetical protein
VFWLFHLRQLEQAVVLDPLISVRAQHAQILERDQIGTTRVRNRRVSDIQLAQLL